VSAACLLYKLQQYMTSYHLKITKQSAWPLCKVKKDSFINEVLATCMFNITGNCYMNKLEIVS
jgi:hypothetical protein